jgi:hypothetical protein
LGYSTGSAVEDHKQKGCENYRAQKLSLEPTGSSEEKCCHGWKDKEQQGNSQPVAAGRRPSQQHPDREDRDKPKQMIIPDRASNTKLSVLSLLEPVGKLSQPGYSEGCGELEWS